MPTAVPRRRALHVPGYYNFTGKNLNKWFAGKAAVAAGTRDAKVFCLGDSTTVGADANGGGTGFGSQTSALAYYTTLATLLGASRDAIVGDNNVLAYVAYNSYDNRVSYTGGWTHELQNGYWGLNDGWTTTSAGTFSFTPTNAFDTITFGCIKQTGSQSPNIVGGMLTVDVDGGAALTTIDTSTANAFFSSTLSVSLGIHTVNVKWVSGAKIWFESIICSDSTTRRVILMNGGANGALVAHYASNIFDFNAAPRLQSLAADLMIYMIGINDWDGGVSLTNFISNINIPLDKHRLGGGDVVLVSGLPSSFATVATYNEQRPYCQVLKQLAYQRGIPFIDLHELWFSSNAWAQAQGYASTDGLHGVGAGYTNIANVVYRAIAAPGFHST